MCVCVNTCVAQTSVSCRMLRRLIAGSETCVFGWFDDLALRQVCFLSRLSDLLEVGRGADD